MTAINEKVKMEKHKFDFEVHGISVVDNKSEEFEEAVAQAVRLYGIKLLLGEKVSWTRDSDNFTNAFYYIGGAVNEKNSWCEFEDEVVYRMRRTSNLSQ